MFASVFLLLFSVCLQEAHLADILVTMPLSSKSHKSIFTPLVNELARRGHTITILSPYKSNKQVEGVNDIVVKELGQLDNVFQDYYIPREDGTRPDITKAYSKMAPLFRDMCTSFLDNEPMKAIIRGEQKFDLLIINMILGECGLGLAYKLQVPFIYASPNTALHLANHNLRIPLPSSFCPSVLRTSTDEMNFSERMRHFMADVGGTLMRHYVFTPVFDKVNREQLGPGVPSAMDIERNVSLIILNSNPVTSYPKPTMPHVIEAGGMQCKPPKPLPKDLADFVSGAGENGFIYMSFGSILAEDKIPEKFIKIFLKVFAKLPLRVVWKLKTNSKLQVPENVWVSNWMPQQDVLGHPSIRMFISHGGLLSVQESTYHGVPILGIPAAIDQMHNLAKVQREGTGRVLNWEELSEETFTDAINDILTDKRYKETMLRKSDAMKDRPQTPLNEAAFWVEYVLRHGGTPDMRSGALKLSIIEFHQLDVIFCLVSVITASLIFTYYLLKCLVKRCCCKSRAQEKQAQSLTAQPPKQKKEKSPKKKEKSKKDANKTQLNSSPPEKKKPSKKPKKE